MKRSKQREAILETLYSTTTHPTADWIYDEVRKKIPNISLGTVYRNLNVLSSENKITKISTIGEQCRYDGDVHPHNHFVCKICQKVMDIDVDYDNSISVDAEKSFDGIIEYHTLLFFGVCKDCLDDTQNNV